MDNNFVMFGNYKEYFQMLDAEQCKRLILMLFEYAETDEINQCDDMQINLVYKTITDNMIIGSRRRIASIENGKKGGRPRKGEVKENSATNKQIEFAKTLGIDPTGLSKYELSKEIKKASSKSSSYIEPDYEEPKEKPTSKFVFDKY